MRTYTSFPRRNPQAVECYRAQQTSNNKEGAANLFNEQQEPGAGKNPKKQLSKIQNENQWVKRITRWWDVFLEGTTRGKVRLDLCKLHESVTQKTSKGCP
jgi:hypothetical protein